MHRRRAAAALNAGFSVIVSERALIIREPILGSFAQDGTHPHLTVLLTCRTGSASGCSRGARSSTTFTRWVGAMLYDGGSSSPTASVASYAASKSPRVLVLAYRPH